MLARAHLPAQVARRPRSNVSTRTKSITASQRTDGSQHSLMAGLMAGTYTVALRSFDNKIGRRPVTGATYYCKATVNLVEVAT